MSEAPRRRRGAAPIVALSHDHAAPPSAQPTRRRPSGAPPPLPWELRRSGLLWAGLAGAVIVFWVIVFVTGLRPTAEVLDRAVVREIAEFRTPSLTRVMRAAQWLGADTTMLVAQLVILAVAVAFRRFRHALVLAGCILFLIWLTTVVQVVFARPRPLGVPILGTWKGFGHPSRTVVALALTLVGGAYTLVPQGKWRVAREAGMSAERQVGTSPITWVCGALLGALALAEVYLAVENPSDVILGGIMGVAVPLVAFRIFVPAE